MNQPEQDRLRADLADRLVEQTLGEVLGAKSPPDLSQQIVAAVQREAGEREEAQRDVIAQGQGARPSETPALRVVGGGATPATQRPGQTLRWPLWQSVSAAAAVLVALGLGFWAGRAQPAPIAAVSDNEVEVFVARQDLAPGTVLKAEHFIARRAPRQLAQPGAMQLDSLVGQTVQLPILKDDLLDPRRFGSMEPPRPIELRLGGELANNPPPATTPDQRDFAGGAPIRVLVGNEQRWVFPPQSFQASLLSEDAGPRAPGGWLVEHAFRATGERPVAQIPIQSGTESWRQVRKLLDAGGLPAADDVRLAEWLNYFATPTAGEAGKFASLVELGACPWQRSHRLLRAVVQAPATEGDKPAAQHAQLHVEFNPAEVAMWRLLGHEHRASTAPGAATDETSQVAGGQTIVALFEIVPAGNWPTAAAAPLKFQSPPALTSAARSGEACAIRLQVSASEMQPSYLETTPLAARSAERQAAELKLAGAVASFALLLRGSAYAGEVTYANVERLVEEVDLPELGDRRQELLDVVKQVRRLTGK